LKIDGFEHDRIVLRQFEALQSAGNKAAEHPQRCAGAGQVGGARRHRGVRAMHRLAHESARSIDGRAVYRNTSAEI